MARRREFDTDEALHRALDVFWRKGYEATSMRDLVGAMHIQKASLYGAFGDKRSLYLAALRRYQQQVLDELTERLAKAPSPARAVRGFVAEVADQVEGGSGKRGCFCVNANIELAPHDDGVAEQLRTHHDRMVALLAATLERARALGEIPRRADCTALATFLLGVVAALNVLGKQRAGREQLQAVVAHGLSVLDP